MLRLRAKLNVKKSRGRSSYSEFRLFRKPASNVNLLTSRLSEAHSRRREADEASSSWVELFIRYKVVPAAAVPPDCEHCGYLVDVDAHRYINAHPRMPTKLKVNKQNDLTLPTVVHFY